MATKPRSKKRKPTTEAPAPDSIPVTEAVEPQENALAAAAPQRMEPANDKNVSAAEGMLSVFAGGVLVVAALFPRTFKQMLMLGLGAGLLYRGRSRRCQVYSALGIDTNK